MTGKYTERSKVDEAVMKILDVIEPGDVINQRSRCKCWPPWSGFVRWAIRRHQKKLFGEDANWYDTHTMLFLDVYNTFSVEPPRATKKPLREYCLSDLSIYRLQKAKMNQTYTLLLHQITDEMIGEDYDIGQLLDIAINGILGFNHLRLLRLFDFGKHKKVCSVGVRTAFEKLYQDKIRRSTDPVGKWLFHRLNAGKYSEAQQQAYRGTDVEATAPAHFANTDHFENEFQLIARFDNGVRVNL